MSYIPGTGNPHAKLLIIGDHPSQSETSPFQSYGAEMLWELLGDSGVREHEVWKTYLYKYYPPNGDVRKIHEVCNPELEKEKVWNEIREINPNCILVLGEESFRALRGHKGLAQWRGSILTTLYGDTKLVATIPPQWLKRGAVSDFQYGHKVYAYIWKSIMKLDIQRAVDESKKKILELPSPFIKTCRDSMELSRFLSKNKHRSKVSLDIESYNCTPMMMGIAFDEHEALVVPLFNKLGSLTVAELPRSDQVYTWVQIDKMLKEKQIIGQNFKYDQEKLEMIGFRFQKQRPIWSDTLIKAHTIQPELPSKAMQMLQSIWTRMPYHKDEGKEFDYKKQNISKLFHYCGLDVISTFSTDVAMDDDLREMSEEYKTDLWSYFYDYKMQLHRVYMAIERKGFAVDLEARAALKLKYQSSHDMIQARLSSAAPDFAPKNIKGKAGKRCHDDHLVNVAAPGQIKQLLYSYLGLPTRKRKGKISADEDTIVALLNNNVKDERRKSILTDILEDRKTRKTLGTYILAKPDFDGRIRCSYRITGTETGRTSTSILKQPLRPGKSGHAFQTLTKHGAIGSDIRTIYTCDKGFCLVQVDLSQAEPRIVALLSRDEELTRAFVSGKVDIHRRTAALVLGKMSYLDLSERFVEEADTLDKEGPDRFLGKTARNGGNYDMGKGVLAVNIATAAKAKGLDVTVSEWRAGKMLEAFHAASPNIKAVFHREIQEAINSTRVLINPYGAIRTFNDRLGEKSIYGEGYAHIPQSTVGDKVKHSILEIEELMPDFVSMCLMGEAHDALLMRFPLGEEVDRAKVVKSVMEREIDFSGCSLKRGKLKIPVDVEVSYTNYRDLEKMKL